MEQPVLDILSFVLPHAWIAADYALRVQPSVELLPPKSSNGDIIYDALSNVDISIQTYFEVLLLSKFPSLQLIAEESASSHNHGFFSDRYDLSVYLDPIDGTKYYSDGFKSYQIAFGVANRKEFIGSLLLFPAIREYYYAVRGLGSFWGDRDTPLDLAKPLKCPYLDLSLTSSSEKKTAIVFSGGKPDEHIHLNEVNIIRLPDHYSSEREVPNTISFIRGEATLAMARNCDFFDWGNLALIVSEAGGIVTDEQGNSLSHLSHYTNGKFSSIILSWSNELHSKFISKIK